jgi:hypothetical protein
MPRVDFDSGVFDVQGIGSVPDIKTPKSGWEFSKFSSFSRWKQR